MVLYFVLNLFVNFFIDSRCKDTIRFHTMEGIFPKEREGFP